MTSVTSITKKFYRDSLQSSRPVVDPIMSVMGPCRGPFLNRWFLTIIGFVATFTFDLFTSKSNQFILVVNCRRWHKNPSWQYSVIISHVTRRPAEVKSQVLHDRRWCLPAWQAPVVPADTRYGTAVLTVKRTTVLCSFMWGFSVWGGCHVIDANAQNHTCSFVRRNTLCRESSVDRGRWSRCRTRNFVRF